MEKKTKRVGRPNIDWELIKLIRRIQKENPIWSAHRIQGELGKLGFDICENTVAKYMCKFKTDPERIQRWLTFLRNHAKYTVGIDFAVVRTITFKAIYVFVAISHDRRKILHIGGSSRPHSQWRCNAENVCADSKKSQDSFSGNILIIFDLINIHFEKSILDYPNLKNVRIFSSDVFLSKTR